MSYIPKETVLLEGSISLKGHPRRYRIYERELESYTSSLDTAAQQRLSATLSRVRNGFGVDLVTPMISKSCSDKDAERIRYRDQMLEWAANTEFKSLNEAEQMQSAKVGPLSIMVPFSKRRSDLMTYWSHQPGLNLFGVPIAFSTGLWWQAYNNVRSKILAPVSLKSTSIDVAFRNMPKGTSLGAPFFSKRDVFYADLIRLADAIEKSGFDSSKYDLPCILFWRGQSRGIGELPKQRSVWGYPHAITLHELRIQEPLLMHLKRLPQFRMLKGLDVVDREVTRFFNDFANSRGAPKSLIKLGFTHYSADFSSFDQTAPPLFIHAAFDLIREMFEKSDTRIIDYVEDRFTNIPLLHPEGIWYGRHGVPSGSGFTNQVDSIIQWLFWECFAVYHNYKITHLLLQGDDGVVAFEDNAKTRIRGLPVTPKLSEIQHVANMFGMLVNVDKGGISKDTIYFCQNVHMRSYSEGGLNVGVRPCERALSGMLSFETPRDKSWKPAHTTLRWLQQVEQCKYHPRFEDLVRLLFEKDSLLKNYTMRAIIAMAGGMKEAEAALKDKSGLFGKPPISGVYTYRSVLIINKLKESGSSRNAAGE